MPGGFLETLAISLSLDTSEFSAGVQSVAHEIDGTLVSAVESVLPPIAEIAEGLGAAASEAGELGASSESIGALTEEIANAASEAGTLGDAAASAAQAASDAGHTGQQAAHDVASAAHNAANTIQHEIPAAAQSAAAGMRSAFAGIIDGFKNFAMQIIAPMAGAFALSGAVKTFMDGALAAREAAQQFGTSSDELQLWQGAITRAGGDVNRFELSLRRMTMSAKVAGDPLKAMYELAGQAEKMSRDAFTAKAKELGIDASTIGVLIQGRKALDEHLKRAKEIGIYEQRHIDLAQDLKIGLWELNGSFDGLKNELLLMVLPAMKKVLSVLTDVNLFLTDHAPFVASVIGVIGAALTIKLLPPLKDLPKYLNAIWGAFTRWAPFIAVVAVLALLIDDFVGYLTGAETEFGEFWSIFGTGPEILAKLKAAWEETKAVLVAVGEGLARFIRYLLDIGKASGLWGAFGQTLRGLLQIVKGIFSLDWGTLHEGLANAFEGIGGLIAGTIKAAGYLLRDIGNALWNALRESLPGFRQWSDGIIEIFTGIVDFDFSKILSGLGNMFSGALDLISGAIRECLSFAGNFWSAVVEIFTGQKIDLAGMLTGAFDALVSVLSGIKQWIFDWFGSLFDVELPDFGALAIQIWDAITGIFGNIKQWVVDWFKNLFSGIELPSIGDILGGVGDLAKGAMGAVGNVVGGAVELGKSAGNAVKDGIGAITGWFSGLFGEAEPETAKAGAAVESGMEQTARAVQQGFNDAWSATAAHGVQAFQQAAATIQQIFASVIAGIEAQLGSFVAGAQQMSMGAGMIPSFAGVRAQNSNVSNVNNNSSSVSIGTMNVSTRATDARGVARGMSGALNKSRLVQARQSGVNQK